LLENSAYLVSSLASPTCQQANELSELLRIASKSALDTMFGHAKAQLAASPNNSPFFMKFLLWLIKTKGVSRDEKLPGLEQQPQSEEKNAIQAYFGSDELVTQFQQLFPETGGRAVISEPFKKFAGFLPSLSVCADDLFQAVMQSPGWSTLVPLLQKAASPSDLELVDKLMQVFASRPQVESSYHAIVINLILDPKPTNPKTIGRLVPQFSIVADHLVLSDIEPLHTRIVKLLTGNSKDNDDSLNILLPPLLALVESQVENLTPEIKSKLVLSEQPVIQTLSLRPPLKVSRVLTKYAILCASLNPNFLQAMTKASDMYRKGKPAQQISPALIVLGSGLVLVRETEVEQVCTGLINIIAPLQPLAPEQLLDECFTFYTEAVRRQKWVQPFTIQLFKEARLAHPTERKFFENAFDGFDESSLKTLVTESVSTMEKWTLRKEKEALIPAKRIAFLLEKLPDMATTIRAQLPADIMASFTSKSGEWPSLVVALKG
jgi:hypothetical protein